MANIDFMGIFINWFPMILLIGVWIFFLRRMQGGKGYMTQFQRDYMEQMKLQIAALERVAAALEKKSA